VRRRSIVVALVVLVLVVTAVAACRPKTYTDGTYQAVSQANDRGYTWARVTIAGDKITKVELKEFSGNGTEKDWATYPHLPAKQAWETLPARFVAKNSWEVDNIAQATSSVNKYKEAVKFALEKAKAKPAITSAYFNGVFMGISDAGPNGWGIAWVTIQNDKITKVDVTDARADGSLKVWAEYGYAQAVEAQQVMPARFVAGGIAGYGNVDGVAGATGSIANWKQAIQRALTSAKVK